LIIWLPPILANRIDIPVWRPKENFVAMNVIRLAHRVELSAGKGICREC
jgi:hypothetical protein